MHGLDIPMLARKEVLGDALRVHLWNGQQVYAVIHAPDRNDNLTVNLYVRSGKGLLDISDTVAAYLDQGRAEQGRLLVPQTDIEPRDSLLAFMDELNADLLEDGLHFTVAIL